MLKRGLVWGFGSITDVKLLNLTLRSNAYFRVFANFSDIVLSLTTTSFHSESYSEIPF